MRVLPPIATVLLTATAVLCLAGCAPTAAPTTPAPVATGSATPAAPGKLVATNVPGPTVTATPNVTLVAPEATPTKTVQPTPAPSTPVPVKVAVGTGAIAARQAAASTAARFYNHFYNYPAATTKALAAVVPDTTYTDSSPKKLTAKQAKQIRLSMERIDPNFRLIDTRGRTDAAVVGAYTGLLYIGAYTAGQQFSFKVDSAQVSVTGDTATVPGTALKVYKKGKLFAAGTDGTSSFRGDATLRLADGKWLYE